jgi:hypothetical protein
LNSFSRSTNGSPLLFSGYYFFLPYITSKNFSLLFKEFVRGVSLKASANIVFLFLIQTLNKNYFKIFISLAFQPISLKTFPQLGVQT